MVYSPCRPLSPWQALGYSFSQKRRLCKASTGSGTVLAFFLARGRWAAIKDANPGTTKGETDGRRDFQHGAAQVPEEGGRDLAARDRDRRPRRPRQRQAEGRSEEHTSELQSLMRISYAVF